MPTVAWLPLGRPSTVPDINFIYQSILKAKLPVETAGNVATPSGAWLRSNMRESIYELSARMIAVGAVPQALQQLREEPASCVPDTR